MLPFFQPNLVEKDTCKCRWWRLPRHMQMTPLLIDELLDIWNRTDSPVYAESLKKSYPGLSDYSFCLYIEQYID